MALHTNSPVLPLGNDIVNRISNCLVRISQSTEDILHRGELFLVSKFAKMTLPSSKGEHAATSNSTDGTEVEQEIQVAGFILYNHAKQNIEWEQILFTQVDILVISEGIFGFKYNNEYITVETPEPFLVFIETAKFLKRCLAIEQIKVRKQAMDYEQPKIIEKKSFSIFKFKKKGKNSKNASKNKNFIPWDMLPDDYHPMLLNSGITEKEWNIYGPALLPTLQDFSSRTEVETIQIRSSFTIQTPISSPLSENEFEFPQVPEGWTVHFDEAENQSYYYNEVYDYSQWDIPTNPAQMCPPAEAAEENVLPISSITPTTEIHTHVPQHESIPISTTRTSVNESFAPDVTEARSLDLTSPNIIPPSSTIPTPISTNISPSPVSIPPPPSISVPPPPSISIPPPPPLNLEKLSERSSVSSQPPLPKSETTMAVVKPRRLSKAMPPKSKPNIVSKPPDLLASIREFSKANLRHVDPKTHTAPDLSKLGANQKLSLMEVLRSKLTDLRDQVEGSEGSESSSESGTESDDSW